MHASGQASSGTMQRQQAEGEAQESQVSSALADLPREVQLVVVRHMDSQTRRIWRLANRDSCAAVYEATSRLSLHTSTPDDGEASTWGLLEKCKGLKELSCSAMECIPGLLPATLELINIGAALIDLSPLLRCTALKRLRLVDALKAQDPQHLPSVLVQLTALHSLDLSSSASGYDLQRDEHARALAPALGTLTALQRLNVSGYCKLGLAALAPAIQQLTNLQQLNLSQTGDVAALAPALRCLSQLQQLDLSINQIDAQGAAALAPAIRQLTRLQQLRLGSNWMHGDIMMSLAPALQHLVLLRRLDLSDNGLGPEGASFLAPALQQLMQLQQLDLGANDLGKEGALALAPAIQNMLGLQRLYLRSNRLGPEGAMAIASAVQHLPGIKLLDIRGSNLVTSAEVEAITLSIREHSPSCRLYLS